MTDRSLAYRPDGVPCAAYGGDHLYYACYNSSTDTWKVQIVDGAYDVGQFASLIFYNNPSIGVTNAFIAYYDNKFIPGR